MYLLCVAAIGVLTVKVGKNIFDVDRKGAVGFVLVKVLLFAFGCAASVLFHPQFLALVKGNIQIWIDCFFALACLAWLSGWPVLAGVLIALAALIKPQLGAMLIWAVLWRQWRFALGIVATAAPVSISALVYFGIHNNVIYFQVLSEISRHGERYYFNESINGIAHRLIGSGGGGILTQDVGYAPYYPIVYAVTLGAFLVFVSLALAPAIIRRGENPKAEDFLTASICFTVGSPIVWPYHYGILLPVYIISLFQILDSTSGRLRLRLLLTIGASWVLCASYAPMVRLLYQAPWNVAGNIHFFAAIMLLVVLATTGQLFRRRAPEVSPMNFQSRGAGHAGETLLARESSASPAAIPRPATRWEV